MASEVPEEESSLTGFPTDPSEFDSDPRISFSRLDDRFVLETGDGQEYEYNGVLKRWVLSVSLIHLFLFIQITELFIGGQ